MHNFSEYVLVFVGLLAIVDPIGNTPVFLSAMAGRPKEDYYSTAKAAAITVIVTLLVAAWLGESIFHFFGIGINSFRVASGILLLMMAVSMMSAQKSPVRQSPDEMDALHDKKTLGIIPLGIPLLSGPGAISLVIAATHQDSSFLGRVALSLIVVLVASICWAVMTFSAPIGRLLGKTGINIFTRLLGLILASLAVEFIAKGALALFPGWAGIAVK
ncbi:MAG: NAAT family transporter [Candidatus Sumerlaeota bacterium]|nr:NAAT family transporter [Candidatus Sumerlaeota bacterium]